MHDADWYAVGAVASRKPVWHFCKKTDGFHVERLVTPFYDSDMGDISIRIYDEAACDASFYATLVGI